MASMKRRGDDIQTRSTNKKPNNQERVVKFFEQLPEIPEEEWEGMHPREHFSVHYWMWIEDKNTLMQKCEYELSRSKRIQRTYNLSRHQNEKMTSLISSLEDLALRIADIVKRSFLTKNEELVYDGQSLLKNIKTKLAELSKHNEKCVTSAQKAASDSSDS